MPGAVANASRACVRARAARHLLPVNRLLPMRLSALFRRLPRRWPAVLTAAALPLLTGALWQLDGPQSTFGAENSPLGPVAQRQLTLFYYTLVVTTVLFVLVGAVLAYATIKFKARNADDEHAEPPEQGHGNPFVELGLTIGSIICLVIIAVPTLSAIWYTYDVPGADTPAKLEEMVKAGKAYEITATGYQWWFKFQYPSERAFATATADARTGKRPEAEFVTANELVIPVGKPVHINLRTDDVIHSFWVPKLAGKVDMIPNRANHLWLQADVPGYYYGQCAEYCGDSHSVMKFRVIALEQKDFDTWLAKQKEPARAAAPIAPANTAPRAAAPLALRNPDDGKKSVPLAGTGDPVVEFKKWQDRQAPAAEDAAKLALISAGRRLFNDNKCSACHTVRGQEGVGVTAPDLTHIGSRSTIAAGLLENDEAHLHDWLADPDHWKPANKMFHGIGRTGKISMPGYIKPDDNGDPMMKDGQPVRNISLSDADVAALTAYLQSLK